MPSVETVSGSGSFEGATLISFSYSEDASPLSIEKLEGGTGQVNAQLVEEPGERGSRISINNEAVLTDEEYGSVNFTIKKVSLNDGLVSIVGDTVQSKLDVERTAQPQGSDASGYNLYEAIIYYCSLVDIYKLSGTVSNYSSLPSSPAEYSVYRTEDTGRLYIYIDEAWVNTDACLRFQSSTQAKLEAIDVDFIGWQGNVWEHLKMLCASQPIDSNDNTLLEMYIKEDELWFRQGLVGELDTSSLIASESLEIDVFDAAQSVQVAKYETDYRANSLIRQQGIEQLDFANLENVSIVDSFQVSANEKITRRILVNASLESVNQPIAVQTIAFPVTYSQYVIVGKDGLPLTPAQWNSQGGSVTVFLTENPNEIEVTITGANYPELEPFKIGVESSGSEEYPAFYVTGTGVFFERTEHTIYTGAPAGEDVSATTIDNPFITNDRTLWDRGLSAARALCGPNITLNQDIPSGLDFGQGVGKMVSAFDSKFRVSSASFSANGVGISASMYVKFSEFADTWSGATFDDFNTAMAGLSFNEFSVVPLSRGA